MENLASYEPLWHNSLGFTYGDHEIVGIPPPQLL